MWQENNLLYVKEKATEIDIVYPRKNLGIAASILGLMAAMGLILVQMREKKKE